MEIDISEQWKLYGDCSQCRRRSYCSKPCTRCKRYNDFEIRRVICEKFFGQIFDSCEKE